MKVEVLARRGFQLENSYKAKNIVYDITDIMSKYRDYEVKVVFVLDENTNEVIMELVKEAE